MNTLGHQLHGAPTVSNTARALLCCVILAGCATPRHDTAATSLGKEAHHSRATPAHIHQSVSDFLKHYIATLESRDPEGIRALFIDDDRFAWFTDGELNYSSATGVLQGMQQFAEVTFRTEMSDLHVTPLDATHTSVSTRFVTELNGPDLDGYRYHGIITMLLERDAETGAWRVLQGHTSTPGGPPR